MPQQEGGTWGRSDGTPTRTVPAAGKVQGKLSRLAFRRNRIDAKYEAVGIPTYTGQEGQREAATLHAEARARQQQQS